MIKLKWRVCRKTAESCNFKMYILKYFFYAGFLLITEQTLLSELASYITFDIRGDDLIDACGSICVSYLYRK